MSKHLIQIDNPQHCALSIAHAGNDNQYCEAGEVVAIDWQPSSGWGLEEAHYTDEDGNIVSIDLSLREFTMPAKAVTVSGTSKRFVAADWKGAVADVDGQNGQFLMSDGAGGAVANKKFYTDNQGTYTIEGNVSTGGNVNSGGGVSAEGNVSAEGDVSAGGGVSAGRNVSARGDVSAGGDVSVGGNVTIGSDITQGVLQMYDNRGNLWFIRVDNSGVMSIATS